MTAMGNSGETDLNSLLKSMQPTLHPQTYIFGHIPVKTPSDASNILKLFSDLPVQMMFREDEGWTVIIEQSVAESISLQSVFPCKKITLNVHSSLEAVGFLAAITGELKELKIGVNPVSGYFHDHLFVPEGKEEAAMEALRKMVRRANGEE